MTKIEKVRAAMKSEGVDALIVFDELNQHYLSDFAFTDGFLLVTLNEAYLVTDFRYYESALEKRSPDFKVEMTDDRFGLIERVLRNNNCKTVGFEGNFVPFSLYKRYSERFDFVTFVNIGNMIETVRQIKSEAEILSMQKAQDIADAAYSRLLKLITPNMTEIEVAAELEYQMRRLGSEGPAFETIAVSGDASAIPHGTPRNIKLKTGFLTMDFGARVDGYLSDMTRTVVVGHADEDMRKLYNTVLKAQLAALDFIKAGVDCADADKVARDIIDKDYPGTFGHSLGHSVGLFIHESPSMSHKSRGRALRAGEIVTVEPGIYLFGKYGCRIEDMVAVREGGIHNFTHSTKELIEIL